MFDYYGNSHIYTALEMQRTALSPVNLAAKFGKSLYNNTLNPMAYTEFGRNLAAGCEIVERMTRIFSKPDFNIDHTYVDKERVTIKYNITKRLTFGRLLHFKKKDFKKKQPVLMIVAPMSGHYSTLLRGTVEGLLPDYDVYITDWQNAQDVPISKGNFDLDDYIDYVIKFIQHLGKGVNVLAVCQPAVPVLAAVSIMSSQNDKSLPSTMTLIGGPIDARKNPTEVNRLAEKKSLHWFTQNVITRVPFNYHGAMRPVYPGFIQLTGFMTMHLDKHIEAHQGLFKHLVDGDGESAETHKKFYNEYLSVMDVTSEFYLQTIETVFQKYSLPKGEMYSRGVHIRPQDITKTALLTIEGERDDISGIGQTKAAIDLCKNLSKDKKKYYMQKNVGHYGLFNGRRFRENIVPTIGKFIASHNS